MKRTLVLVIGMCVVAALFTGAFFVFTRTERFAVIPSATETKNAEDGFHETGDDSPTSIISLSPTPIPLDDDILSPEPPPIGSFETIRLLSAASVPRISSAFDFALYLPSSWRSEAIVPNDSLNIFDPSLPDVSNLERAQVFVQYFRSSTFQTLRSVNVLSRKESTIADRPAVDYVVEKKPSYAPFRSQPSWRNTKHRVLDVRVSDANPSAFYSFAKRPDVDDAVFDAMLATLRFDTERLVFNPVEPFGERVTKKPFGMFITPTSSPVVLERFTGYHTGMDVEMPDDISATASIPIFSIADGIVVLSRTAQGYGGVIAIRHEIEGKSILAIYGHLKPASLTKTGVRVRTGQQIGVLGAPYSKETDRERRHLHFGLYTGSDINIAGYIKTQEELSAWIDPMAFLADKVQ